MVVIIPYEDRYVEDFRRLNVEWLDAYNLMESHDLEILNDPKATILNNGGYIWLAQSANEIVGSAGLIRMTNHEYELAKMAVAPAHRGKGISKLLIRQCIDKAKETGASKLMLYSNSQLQTAIRLYTTYGFRHVSVTDAPFLTADVKMELEF